jgi:ABC-2 type transport system permease protein
VRAASAVARRTFADGRIRTFSFAVFFFLVALVNVIGYRHTLPTLEDRIAFVRSFGDNRSVRLFYGVPHDLLTDGGYVAWRVGGILPIFAAMWGLLAAVRALRTEEDAGRQELVLTGAVTRRSAFLAALAGIGAGAVVLWLALLAAFVVTGLAVGGSAYLALAIVVSGAVFAGVGAVASQVAPNRRIAVELGSAVLALAFLLRVAADTSDLGWLRWATPLGWIEELRAFADPRPAVLLLPLGASALLLLAAGLVSARRDVGAGMLRARDSAEPDLRLLGSPAAFALRSERAVLATWIAGVGAFAFVFGVISNSIATLELPESVTSQLEEFGGVAILTPAGYLGATFLAFVFALSLFGCSQIAAARREETEQLETLLTLPVRRRSWFGGRLALAVAAAVAIALAAGLLSWAGAASQGADVGFGQMLGAGANCLPVAFLFLGLAALAFAVLPRASVGIAYGLVCVAFMWELFGAVLGAPEWLLDLSPFHHMALVPAQPFRGVAAAAMLAVGAIASLAALRLFARRDLVGA